MPIITYNKKYLLRLLGFKISDKELAANIDKMTLNAEKIDDTEVAVELYANRPDIISVVGLARALRYFMRRSRKFNYRVKEAGSGFVVNVGSHVSKFRPYVASMVVRKLRMDEEELRDIINFTDKLTETYGRRRSKIAIGLHDLRHVRPPFYYDAYDDEEYVPLNNRSKMRYSDVLKREEQGRMYGHLVGSGERKYAAFKDSEGTISLVPILNSERTRVTASTQDMIIDITGTSKHIIEKVSDLLAADFMDRSCDVYSVAVNYGGKQYQLPRMQSETISIPLEQINREIGVALGFNNAILLANKMGYEAALVGRNIRFRVPAYRLDVINEQDVIEDVAVAYGYDYIQPVAVPSVQQGVIEETSKRVRLASELMLGLGFSETLNFYLTNEKTNFKQMGLELDKNCITIANPKTEAMTMMRTWLMPSLLSNIGKSMHDKLPIKLFELDMVFGFENGGPREKYHLAAVKCDAGANFNDIKAALEGLLGRMGIAYEIAKGEHKSFIDGRCATVVVDKKNIGFLGEIHPEVLTSFGIEEPTVAFEIEALLD